MRKLKYIVIIFLFFNNLAFAQDPTQDAQNNVLVFDEFVYKGKIYQSYSNWFSVGVGKSYYTGTTEIDDGLNISYNFHLKRLNSIISKQNSLPKGSMRSAMSKLCFTVGYHYSSDATFIARSTQKLNDFYLGLGLRKETLHSNYAFFVAPTYSYGNYYRYSQRLQDDQVVRWYTSFQNYGLYAKAEYTYKLLYDLGIGVAAYANFNSKYTVYGVQLQIYFSGAFKGQIK